MCLKFGSFFMFCTQAAVSAWSIQDPAPAKYESGASAEDGRPEVPWEDAFASPNDMSEIPLAKPIFKGFRFLLAVITFKELP